MVIFLNLLIPLGSGGKSMVLKMADTSIPSKETVITRLVSTGKLNDSTEKLNLFPPKNIGSHPKIKSNSDAVAHDQ